ncbi:MAG: Uma2 family endonuclease [Bryobacteraceae bacterium]|nr:Uma2 family endonuclease [Bryobacteraceae bacterium]
MSVETLVSVEQYLNSCYDPDVEYVDGTLVERNVGDWLHSLVQSNLIYWLRHRYPDLKVVPEFRSQTAPTRFRLPDVTVLLAPPRTRYLMDAAFIAIEILSEDDRMTGVLEKLAEYEAKGVPNIWVIDPRLEQIFVFRSGSLALIQDDILRTADAAVELRRAEIFQS